MANTISKMSVPPPPPSLACSPIQIQILRTYIEFLDSKTFSKKQQPIKHSAVTNPLPIVEQKQQPIIEQQPIKRSAATKPQQQENRIVRRSLRIQELYSSNNQYRQPTFAQIHYIIQQPRRTRLRQSQQPQQQPPQHLIRVLMMKKQPKNKSTEPCPICYQTNTAIKTQCGHWYCSCLLQYIIAKTATKQQQNEEQTVVSCPCPLCRTPIQKIHFINQLQYDLIENCQGLLQKCFRI